MDGVVSDMDGVVSDMDGVVSDMDGVVFDMDGIVSDIALDGPNIINTLIKQYNYLKLILVQL